MEAGFSFPLGSLSYKVSTDHGEHARHLSLGRYKTPIPSHLWWRQSRNNGKSRFFTIIQHSQGLCQWSLHGDQHAHPHPKVVRILLSAVSTNTTWREIIFIPDKIVTRAKKITRDTEGHYIMLKGLIHQEDISILNAPNNRAAKYVTLKLIESTLLPLLEHCQSKPSKTKDLREIQSIII